MRAVLRCVGGVMEQVPKWDIGAGSLLARYGEASCQPKEVWVPVLVWMGVVERASVCGDDV